MHLDMKKGNHNCVRRNHGRIIFHLGVEKVFIWSKNPRKD